MTTIDTIAKQLQMKPDELLLESLRTYLDRRLTKVEEDRDKKRGFRGTLMSVIEELKRID